MIKYEVKPVTTYIVVRVEDTGNTGSMTTYGQYDTKDIADRAATAFNTVERADRQEADTR